MFKSIQATHLNNSFFFKIWLMKTLPNFLYNRLNASYFVQYILFLSLSFILSLVLSYSLSLSDCITHAYSLTLFLSSILLFALFHWFPFSLIAFLSHCLCRLKWDNTCFSFSLHCNFTDIYFTQPFILDLTLSITNSPCYSLTSDVKGDYLTAVS